MERSKYTGQRLLPEVKDGAHPGGGNVTQQHLRSPAWLIPVDLDRDSPVPLYRQVTDQLARSIIGGTVNAGEPFESELSLAARLGLSRPTVRRSIAELVERGLLIRKRGVGTTVARPAQPAGRGVVEIGGDLVADRPSITRLVRLAQGERNRTAAEALRTLPLTPLIYLERQHLIDGQPSALLRDWLPPAFGDVTTAEAASCEVGELLRRRGVTLLAAQRTVACRPATAADRSRFGGLGDGVVLTVRRCLFDHAGRPLAYGEHSYRADRYQLDLTLRAT